MTSDAATIRSRLRLFSRPRARSSKRYAVPMSGCKDTPEESDRRILDDQIAYYRARAPEYDAWWFRNGRFDRGPEHNAAWHADVDAVVDAAIGCIERRRPATLLELACGTGLFTRWLAPRVASISAVDAS